MIDEIEVPLGEVRILNPQIREHIDVFRVIMLSACARTVFPELLEIFGPEAVIKFIDIFGGSRIHVPSREFLAQSVRDTDIYVMMAHSTDQDLASDYLALKYDIDSSYVWEVFRRVQAIKDQYGI